jgi:UPF0755 protein
LFLSAVLAGGAVAWLVLAPYGPETATLVDVTPGSSAVAIGRKLEAAGVVRSRYAFDLVRWLRRGRLRAGVYQFDHPAPVTEVYARIARGDVATIAVTVPEGANIFDIAARVEQAGFCMHQEFLAAAVSQVWLIADLDPGAKSLEGYLFPDTYRFPPRTNAVQMVTVMVRRATGAEGERASRGYPGIAGGTRNGRGRGPSAGGERVCQPASKEHALEHRSRGDLRIGAGGQVAGHNLCQRFDPRYAL